MRAKWATACLAMAGALTVAGCSGGDPEASPSPTPSNTATRWHRGEITADRDLCAAIPPSVLKPLNLQSGSSGGASGSVCNLTPLDRDTPVSHAMTVRVNRYEPPAARPDHSATEEARHEFTKPLGWGYQEGTAVRGYGDETRISRTIGSFRFRHEVKVATRVRNVIIQVFLSSSAEKDADGGRVAPIGALEFRALGAVGAMLGRLGAPVRPPKPAAYRSGEAKQVHDVCRDVPDGGRLVPGGKRTAVAALDGRSAGCAWRHGDDDLSVVVEAVPPGADGRDATATATQALGARANSRNKNVPGVGDAAGAYTYDGGTLRSVDLWARRGNLVVTVSYERWHGDKSVKALRGDAAELAKAALDGYP